MDFGFEDAPYVIIGMDIDIILDNAKDWRALDPEGPENFRDIVQSMNDRWRLRGYSLAGFRIIDQKGKYLGDWYSIF